MVFTAPGHSSGSAKCLAISRHPRKMLAELGDAFTTSVKKTGGFSQQAGWGEFGNKAVTLKAVWSCSGTGGPTVSARMYLTQAGEAKSRNGRSSKKVHYHLPS